MIAESSIRNVETFKVHIPKIDRKRFVGLIKAMGWTFEKQDEKDETEYIRSNAFLMKAIQEGDETIASGNVKTTPLEDLWK